MIWTKRRVKLLDWVVIVVFGIMVAIAVVVVCYLCFR